MVLCVEGLKPSACGLTLCCPLTIQTCNHRRILLQETCIISQDPEAQRCYRDIILKPVWFWGSITKCGWFTELCGLQGCRSLNALCWGGSLQAYHLNSKRKSLDQKTDTPASGPLNAGDLPGCIFSRRAIYLGHCFLVWGFLFGCLSPLLCCFLLLCFFVSLLFCFFAFLNLLSCFSVFLLFCFSGFLLLFFLLLRFLFASLLLCFSVFLLVYFCFLFLCFLVLCFVFFLLSLLFPQQRKLGVFSHSKGSGERSEQPNPHGARLGTGFRGRVSFSKRIPRSSQLRTAEVGNLATLQGNLFLEPLLGNLRHCSWNPCL